LDKQPSQISRPARMPSSLITPLFQRPQQFWQRPTMIPSAMPASAMPRMMRSPFSTSLPRNCWRTRVTFISDRVGRPRCGFFFDRADWSIPIAASWAERTHFSSAKVEDFHSASQHEALASRPALDLFGDNRQHLLSNRRGVSFSLVITRPLHKSGMGPSATGVRSNPNRSEVNQCSRRKQSLERPSWAQPWWLPAAGCGCFMSP
jgi:hypothetical protein